MQTAFKIEAQNIDITRLLNDRLISITVTDDEGFTSDTLEIQLDDRDSRLIIPPLNSELKVWLGYKGEELFYRGLYVYDEYELEGLPHVLTLRAKAAHAGNSATFEGLETNLKQQRSRSWSSQTLEAIVVQIAAEAGLTPRVFPSLGGEVIAQVDQTNESNRNLLTRLAKQRGAVFKVAGGFLIFVPKGEAQRFSGGSTTPIFLYYGQRPAGAVVAALSSWRLVNSESDAYLGVQASWHDIGQAAQLSVIAGDSKGPVKILKGNYPNADEAGQAATAELDRITRGKTAPTFTLAGHPLLAAESLVQVSGLRSQFNGLWSVKKAVHKYDKQSGYSTTIDCEIPKPTVKKKYPSRSLLVSQSGLASYGK